MSIDYEGEVVLEINGQEVEIVSLSYTHTINRKVVRTMNSTGRAKGTRRGVELVESFTIKAPAPVTGEYPWHTLKDARLVTYPFAQPSKRTTFFDVSYVSKGASYSTDDGDVVRDINLTCLRIAEPT